MSVTRLTDSAMKLRHTHKIYRTRKNGSKYHLFFTFFLYVYWK